MRERLGYFFNYWHWHPSWLLKGPSSSASVKSLPFSIWCGSNHFLFLDLRWYKPLSLFLNHFLTYLNSLFKLKSFPLNYLGQIFIPARILLHICSLVLIAVSPTSRIMLYILRNKSGTKPRIHDHYVLESFKISEELEGSWGVQGNSHIDEEMGM